ncbi:MAG: glycosyltransferase family 4 protein, partial [Peptococcaceae bacterium]|nr:glycosyltransferase family 4 protein [Peptococcaceae bacterium]
PDGQVISRLEAVGLDTPLIIFYGKYLWTKGIHLLIAAIPLILQENPKASFLLVGFGRFRVYLETLLQVLSHGKRQVFFRLLEYLREQEVANHFGSCRYWGSLQEKMKNEEFSEKYWQAAESMGDKVILTGFMSHEVLKDLIPCCDVAVAPSIFPESFGLVAVEALASGLIPVQTNHSAFHEVIESYAKAFEEDILPRELKFLGVDECIVANLAENINHLLDFYRDMTWQDRSRIRKKAQAISLKKYSWQGVLASIIKEYQAVREENQPTHR